MIGTPIDILMNMEDIDTEVMTNVLIWSFLASHTSLFAI